MKILIIEGVATSGKSTLTEAIVKLLNGHQVKIFSEENTHIPIMNKPDEFHIDFFNTLITSAIQTKSDLIIFDRLHLTQAHRAKSDIAIYEEVESLLAQHSTLMAYLKVDENTLAERVKIATEHREKKWLEYVQTKGKTFDEIAKYYINQQRSQLDLISQSKLPSRVFDTTQHDYQTVAKSIVNEWYL